MYKAIIFDFFGVIYTDPLNEWLAHHGLMRTGELAEASLRLDQGDIPMEEFFSVLSRITKIPSRAIESEFQEASQSHTELIALLKVLRTHYMVGLLSDSNSDYLRPILRRLGIDTCFNEILISSDVGMTKRDIGIFHLMLRRLGVNPHQTVLIEDTARNIVTAESIGIHGVLYTAPSELTKTLAALGISSSDDEATSPKGV